MPVLAKGMAARKGYGNDETWKKGEKEGLSFWVKNSNRGHFATNRDEIFLVGTLALQQSITRLPEVTAR